MLAPPRSNFRMTAASASAGPCAASQSGLPPPVRIPAMSYMSFTAAVSPASGPCAAPARGSGKSCGTNALRKWCDADMLSPFALCEIPIENPGAVPRDDACVAENLLERALHVSDVMRNARHVGMTGDRHDLRALACFFIKAAEMIERPRIHDLRIVGKGDDRAVGGLGRQRF